MADESIGLSPQKIPTFFTNRSRPYMQNKDFPLCFQAKAAYQTPDGKYVAILSKNRLQIWSTIGKRFVAEFFSHNRSQTPYLLLAGTDDSRFILFVQNVKSVGVWDTKKRSLQHTFRCEQNIRNILVNRRDECWIYQDGNVQKWDLYFKVKLLDFRVPQILFFTMHLAVLNNLLVIQQFGSFIYFYDKKKDDQEAYGALDVLEDENNVCFSAFSPSLLYCLQGQNQGNEQITYLISIMEQKILKTIPASRPNSEYLEKIYFTIDGRYFAISYISFTEFYEFKNCKLISVLSHPLVLITSCNQLLSAFVHKKKLFEWCKAAVNYLKRSSELMPSIRK